MVICGEEYETIHTWGETIGFCPYCDSENLDDYTFCINCHKKLPAKPGADQQPPQQGQFLPPPPPPQGQYTPPPTHGQSQQLSQQDQYPPRNPPAPKRSNVGVIVIAVALVFIIIFAAVGYNFLLNKNGSDIDLTNEDITTIIANLTKNQCDIVTAEAKTQQAMVDLAEMMIDRYDGNLSNTSIILTDDDISLAMSYFNTFLKENARVIILANDNLALISKLDNYASETTGTRSISDTIETGKSITEFDLALAERVMVGTSMAVDCLTSPTNDGYIEAVNYNEETLTFAKDYAKGIVLDFVTDGWYGKVSDGLGWLDITTQAATTNDQGDTQIIGSSGSMWSISDALDQYVNEDRPMDPTSLIVANIDPPSQGGDTIIQLSKPSSETVSFSLGMADDAGLPTSEFFLQNIEKFVNSYAEFFPLNMASFPSISLSELLGSICAASEDLFVRTATAAQEWGIGNVVSITDTNIILRPNLIDLLALPSELISTQGTWAWTTSLGDLSDVSVSVYGTEFGVDNTLNFELIDGVYCLDINNWPIDPINDDSGNYTFRGTGMVTGTLSAPLSVEWSPNPFIITSSGGPFTVVMVLDSNPLRVGPLSGTIYYSPYTLTTTTPALTLTTPEDSITTPGNTQTTSVGSCSYTFIGHSDDTTITIDTESLPPSPYPVASQSFTGTAISHITTNGVIDLSCQYILTGLIEGGSTYVTTQTFTLTYDDP